MPGTGHHFSLDATFGERTATVGTGVVDGVIAHTEVEERDCFPANFDSLSFSRTQLGGCCYLYELDRKSTRLNSSH